MTDRVIAQMSAREHEIECMNLQAILSMRSPKVKHSFKDNPSVHTRGGNQNVLKAMSDNLMLSGYIA
jgi:hypothetical protein